MNTKVESIDPMVKFKIGRKGYTLKVWFDGELYICDVWTNNRNGGSHFDHHIKDVAITGAIFKAYMRDLGFDNLQGRRMLAGLLERDPMLFNMPDWLSDLVSRITRPEYFK